MPDVNLIIDGHAVTVPAGTNIVDAAQAAGVSVPVFCYHPKMRAVGMCRMCMVEVWTPKIDPATRQPVIGEDGKPVLALMMNKLQPGCVTPVSDGMEVRTVTDRVEFAQKGMLEFLLTSHPLDCPVCDKGGECPLQNLTMRWGPGISRFDYSDKVHFEKPIALGDLIYLDRERCILCSRCVRFEDDLAGDPVLGFDNRGRSWEIIAKGEPAFDSKFSGNTTDICPVGALTTADFRFKARVWELQAVPSICTNCPVGCNITLDMRHNELKRVMPRENDFVNEIWNCDKGRFGMRYIEHAERLTVPLIRRGNDLRPASWDEALALVADRLVAARGHVAGLAGPDLPNEDLFAFMRLLKGIFDSGHVDYRPGGAADPAVDIWTTSLGVGQGTNLMTLGKGTAVLIVGADPEEEAPLYVLRVRAMQSRGADVTVINPYPTKLGKSATRSLMVRPGTGPQVLMAMLKALSEQDALKAENLSGRLRGLDALRAKLANASVDELAAQAGVAVDALRAAAQAFATAENGIIIYGQTALRVGAPLMDALAALALSTGKVGRANNGLIGLNAGGNARAAIDFGLYPHGQSLSAAQMWPAIHDRRLKAMFIAGMDPAADNAAAAAALDELDFVVVQDMFLTETTKRADVVLPLAAIAERDGTTTNAERRVQRFRQARRPQADVRAVWQVAQQLAQAILKPELVESVETATTGKSKQHNNLRPAAPSMHSWDWLLTQDVTEAITQQVAGYSSATLSTLSPGSSSWGRQLGEQLYYDGTSYTNFEGLGVQLPALADDAKSALTISGPILPATADEGLLLMLAPRAYDGRTWAFGSKLAPRMVPPHVILSISDAQRIGVAIGEAVSIHSEAGTITLAAQIDSGLAAGTVLLPDVHGTQAASIVTGAITAVRVTKA